MVKAQLLGKLMSEHAYLIIRCLLAVVFFYAGATKIMNTEGFATVISGYGLLPDSLVSLSAIVLPVAEILIATALVWDLKGSLFLYSVLLLVFMGVLVHGINMGLDVDCGCFAPGDAEGEAYHSLREALFRDLFLFSGCVYLYWLRGAKDYRPRSIFAFISKK
ncbi:MauE/DoxX family redox-associated membrane protein [Maridesulfovibrio ferrireducens]|uniref:MauE/DoxX family redox-associated membrane protein n=1 Tax=Maridesulfovibrio ferrireducens TaxID=246191 RepID=UPI001A275E1B|nr:MauE/DoxX family redox-associated membrane protein [Maridesulfovibrio ferrireducens]MBI9111742.1 DoxX family membrane protein [Maridesulfovibrio ferrireducens]